MSILKRALIAVACATAVLTGSPLVYAVNPGSTGTGGVNSAPDKGICQQSGSVGAGLNNSAVCTGANDATTNNKNPLVGADSLLQRIVRIILLLTGLFSVIMIIIGGFRYVVSGGDSNATGSAKKTILYAVIGLVISLMAQLIVAVVINGGVL